MMNCLSWMIAPLPSDTGGRIVQSPAFARLQLQMRMWMSGSEMKPALAVLFCYFLLKLPACIGFHLALVWTRLGWGGGRGVLPGKRPNNHKYCVTFELLKLLWVRFSFYETPSLPLQPAQMHFRYGRWRADVLQMSQWNPATSLTVTLLLCVFTAQMTTTNTDTAGNRMIHTVSFCCCRNIYSSLPVSVITVTQTQYNCLKNNGLRCVASMSGA